MIKNLISILMLLMVTTACSASPAKAETESQPQPQAQAAQAVSDTTLMITDSIPAGSVKVAVSTTAGDFVLLLYGDTPGHRDNFLKHVKNGTYDNVLFHRVIKDFMVQAGDPSSKEAKAGELLGSGDASKTIPAEIVFPRHFHKRGALAAARTGDQVNPKRESSGSQFYIVTGRTYTPEQLNQMDMRLRHSIGQNYFNKLAQEHEAEIRAMQKDGDREGLSALQEQLSNETNKWLEANPVGMTKEMREAYTTIGGTPHLDNEYTVYGEVISGMSTIDAIQRVATDGRDRPLEDVRIISMKVIDE